MCVCVRPSRPGYPPTQLTTHGLRRGRDQPTSLAQNVRRGQPGCVAAHSSRRGGSVGLGPAARYPPPPGGRQLSHARGHQPGPRQDPSTVVEQAARHHSARGRSVHCARVSACQAGEPGPTPHGALQRYVVRSHTQDGEKLIFDSSVAHGDGIAFVPWPHCTPRPWSEACSACNQAQQPRALHRRGRRQRQRARHHAAALVRRSQGRACTLWEEAQGPRLPLVAPSEPAAALPPASLSRWHIRVDTATDC